MLAVTVKENVNPKIILEDPNEIIDELSSRPETPRTNEDAQAVADREARDRIARDKVILENHKEENAYLKTDTMCSTMRFRNGLRLVYLWLEARMGKKRNSCRKIDTRKNQIEFRETVNLAKVSFEKTKNITYKRYRLFTRAHETGETLESFHAALTAQAATAELGGLEEELVRQLFISRMKNTTLQDTLAFETFTPDEELKRAIKFEQSKQRTQAFQKSVTGNTSVGQFPGPQFKIKQEPIMTVRNRNSNYKRPNRDQSKKKWNDNRNANSRTDKKPCTRCASTFGVGHLKSTPAMGKTCKSCNKQNHFAKMCRSSQVNEIAEENSSLEEECNLIHSFDSCDEFEIMVVEPKSRKPLDKRFEEITSGIDDENETNVTQDIRKNDIRRDPRSHQIKALKALVRVNNKIIKMTIDTVSPVSFLNWATAKQLLEGSSEIKFIPAEN